MDSKDGTMDYDADYPAPRWALHTASPVGNGESLEIEMSTSVDPRGLPPGTYEARIEDVRVYPRQSVNWSTAQQIQAGVVEREARLEPMPWTIRHDGNKKWRVPSLDNWAHVRARLQGRPSFDPHIWQVSIADLSRRCFWFGVAERGNANRDNKRGPYVCAGSTSYASAAEWVKREMDSRSYHPSPYGFVVRANNATQVRRWTKQVLGNRREKEPEMPIFQELEYGNNESDRLRHQAEHMMAHTGLAAGRLLEQAAFLDTLPKEPESAEGEPNIIYFEKKFTRGGPVYNYAAIQFHDAWYTSGPKEGHNPRIWTDLVRWIYSYQDGSYRTDAQIWHSTELTPL